MGGKYPQLKPFACKLPGEVFHSTVMAKDLMDAVALTGQRGLVRDGKTTQTVRIKGEGTFIVQFQPLIKRVN